MSNTEIGVRGEASVINRSTLKLCVIDPCLFSGN